MTMKRIITAMALLTVVLCVDAVNAKKMWITVKQGDSTEVELMLRGNEHFHYFMTRDSLPVLKNEADGSYYYANSYGYGMSRTAQMVHEIGVRTLPETRVASEVATTVSVASATPMMTNTRSKSTELKSSYLGSKKGLVILTQFSDTKFSLFSNSKVTYDSVLNCKNYHSGDFIGSVYDYFYAQSSGQFNLTFDVVGPVTLSNTMSYYGGNDNSGEDKHPGQMAAEACLLVADSVDFSNYDWNGDGIVDQVFIQYAGYGEADGGASNTIWPHEWELSSSDYGKSLTIDGETVDTYACANELAHGTSTPTSVGIGTFCHEFSHCLGFPDFYDKSGQSNFGMDAWDLLDYGNYNGNGFCPAGYTSYEKWFCGWQEPIVLSSACDVDNIVPLSGGGNTYVVYNDNNDNEYYLLENRQQTSWDAALPGAGLLILHVDYSSNAWTNNTVNTSRTHQRMTIFHADNDKGTSISSLAGDPFPYNGNDSLTNNSAPASTLYNSNTDGNKLMNKSITSIVQNSDGTVSFKFMGGGAATSIENVEQTNNVIGKSVVVYDTGGRVMLRTKNYTGTEEIPAGTYILRTQDGVISKFIKQ